MATKTRHSSSDLDLESGRLDEKGCLPSGETSSSDDEPIASGETVVVAMAAVDDGDDADDALSIGGQRNLLSRKRLLIAFSALSLCLFVSFIDQTSVSTSIPAIADELDTGTATSWIGASFLIASTAFQLINGRLSDLFGRKNLLLICLGLMALGDLLCGFSRTKEQLFAFRSIAGIGGGGINSIVMIIVSDITTLENRGKYQGILGAILALANGVGPFIGGAVVEKSTWRWVFWMVPMITVPAAIVVVISLPLKHRSGNYLEKVKKIDYGGIALNMAAVLLVLIPLSGGGVAYAWSSPFLISSITIGGILAILFVLYEWKLAPIPIMPLRLFRAPHCAYLYGQSFLMGLCYFGNLFYLPIYFQSIHGYSALVSGALILPVILSTSAFSVLSGQFMARVGYYMPPVAVGFLFWTLGNGLTVKFDPGTPLWQLIVILTVEGAGIGMTLQPTLVGMYANSLSADRAVTTGLRNFIRTIGGAFGLVLSGAILSNTLSTQLSGQPFATTEVLATLTSSAYRLNELDLSADEKKMVLDSYMLGLHSVFIFFTVTTGISAILSLGIGNTCLKEKSAEQGTQGTETPPPEAERATSGTKDGKTEKSVGTDTVGERPASNER